MTPEARPRPRPQTRGLLGGRLVLLRPAVSLASSASLNCVLSFRPRQGIRRTSWYGRRAYSSRVPSQGRIFRWVGAPQSLQPRLVDARGPQRRRVVGVCPKLRED